MYYDLKYLYNSNAQYDHGEIGHRDPFTSKPTTPSPLRQYHHHPPCIMFWNTNIIPMHNMTTGKLGTEILLHQISSVPPPLRPYHHHPPCIMFWNNNIIPIHNMTTGKFLNRSLTENWPAVVGGNKKAGVGIVGKKFKTSEEIPIITADWGKFFSFLFTAFFYFLIWREKMQRKYVDDTYNNLLW